MTLLPLYAGTCPLDKLPPSFPQVHVPGSFPSLSLGEVTVMRAFSPTEVGTCAPL